MFVLTQAHLESNGRTWHSGREVTGQEIFKSHFLVSADSPDYIHVHMKH